MVEFVPMTRFCAKEHRARVDGRATARHLLGMIERALRCHTVKVSAESSGAVASNVFFESLTTRHSGTTIVDHSVKRSGPHTHGLTHTAPTDLTVAAALVRKGEGILQAAALAPVVESKPVNMRT